MTLSTGRSSGQRFLLDGDFERLAGANREVDALFVIPAETLVHFSQQRPRLISVALDVANTIRILVDHWQWLGIGNSDDVTKTVDTCLERLEIEQQGAGPERSANVEKLFVRGHSLADQCGR